MPTRRLQPIAALGTWLRRLWQWCARWYEPAGSAAAVPAESPIVWLRLGEPVQPLLARFAEPTVQVALEQGVPLLRLHDCRPLTVAIAGNRVAAIRYSYPAQPSEFVKAQMAAEAERFLLPETRAAQQYQLLPRPDGWVLATPDCPPACLLAVEQGQV